MDELSALYGDGARQLQDTFDSRRLADRLDSATVHTSLTPDDRALIERQSFFLLSTVDAEGWPDVSYKGGAPGFVDTDETTIRFPSFDGNGMFRSLGNIVDDGRVALLFIDLDQPWRLRVHGRATVSTDPADLESRPGSTALVTVTVGRAFPNCGRYIHDFRGGELSPFVPDEHGEAPVPDWKRLPFLAEVLPGTTP